MQSPTTNLVLNRFPCASKQDSHVATGIAQLGEDVSGADAHRGPSTLSTDETASSTADSSDIEEGKTDREELGQNKPLDPEVLKAERKAHKAIVKEANRERRKHKLPKHVKKKAVSRHQRK